MVTGGAPGGVIFRHEGATQQRLDPKELKNVGRETHTLHPLRLPRIDQIGVVGADRAQAIEQRALIAVVAKFRQRKRGAGAVGIDRINPDQPIGLAKGIGPQQDRIDDGEDGHVGADPEGEGENGDRGKAG